MQNEQQKPALEDLQVNDEAPQASVETQLIQIEQIEEEPKGDSKSKKAIVGAAVAALAGGVAGAALGAQNADFIGGLFDGNNEHLAVEPDPDPNAIATNDAQHTEEIPVTVEPEVAPVADETTPPANDTDLIGVDLNGDGTIDVLAIDANHDGVAEGMATDENHDGILDTFYIDTDHDGDMDTVMIDTNQDGTPDTQDALSADQEFILNIEAEGHHDTQAEEVHQEVPLDMHEDINHANDIADNDIPQDEFDPNADMTEWT